MRIADPPAFALFGVNVPYSRESWSKYLKSLDKFILSMNFLTTDDVVVLGKPFDVDVFSFPGRLRRKTWIQ